MKTLLEEVRPVGLDNYEFEDRHNMTIGWTFRILSLSAFQCAGNNQRLSHLRVALKYISVNSDLDGRVHSCSFSVSKRMESADIKISEY